MPLALAFVASALLHIAALVGPGLKMPGSQDAEPPTTLEAVIAKAPARTEAASAPRPVQRPPPARQRPPSTAQPAVIAESSPVAAPAAEVPPPEPPVVAEPAPPVEPAPAAAARTALPGRGRVRYVLTRGEGGLVIGQSIHSWEHDGFRYKLKSLTETTGLAALFRPAKAFQVSEGDVTDSGLRPLMFRHERASGIETVLFDWVRRVMIYAGREEKLVEGAQDMLSMYYQMVLLAPRSGAIEMAITAGKRLETYRWEVIGEEAVAFPGGARRAVRIGAKSGPDYVELWLALGEGAESRGMPLKIRFTDRKGEIYDQVLDDAGPEEGR